jgi:hypothetical protein
MPEIFMHSFAVTHDAGKAVQDVLVVERMHNRFVASESGLRAICWHVATFNSGEVLGQMV